MSIFEHDLRSSRLQIWRANSATLLQSLERKYLTLRTGIKRLTRRTICFSKSVVVQDTMIGLFINQFLFGIHHY